MAYFQCPRYISYISGLEKKLSFHAVHRVVARPTYFMCRHVLVLKTQFKKDISSLVNIFSEYDIKFAKSSVERMP